MRMAQLAIAVGFILATTEMVLADEGDDTLRFLLKKSDFVALGEITSEPIGVVYEVGVIHYTCAFRVGSVLKGEEVSEDEIHVTIVQFAMTDDDRVADPPKKNRKCILFLKKAGNEKPTWKTADVWFGLQRPSPWMARSLQRLADESEEHRD